MCFNNIHKVRQELVDMVLLTEPCPQDAAAPCIAISHTKVIMLARTKLHAGHSLHFQPL